MKLQFIFILTIAVGFLGFTTHSAYSIAYFPPPLKQIENGVSPQAVTCTAGLQLVYKATNNNPSCVKPSSAQKLVERGWALTDIITNEDDNQREFRMVTQENNNQTIELKAGESFLLKLGEEHNWNIEIDNNDVVSRVKNIAVIRGAQGVYEAKMPGSATLSVVGEPLCREEVLPCGAPTILFKIQINVS